MNTNFVASILQVGLKSNFFNIERVCKQGDPIVPYLFMSCGQILQYLIHTNLKIKGVVIGTEEIRMTQFANPPNILRPIPNLPSLSKKRIIVVGDLLTVNAILVKQI